MTLSFNYFGINKFNENIFGEPHSKKMLSKFDHTVQKKDVGFFNCIDDESLLRNCQKVYKQYEHKKYFIHVGIGGSSLGPQMLIEALKKNDCPCQFYFMDNIDPDFVHDILSKIDPKEALFYFVSKSGSTIETLSQFAVISNFLKDKGIFEDEFNQHMVFCSTSQKGSLFEMATYLNAPMLEIPENVGGRFSVLTSVGFFPALFANINLTDLLHGAKEIRKSFFLPDHKNNNLLNSACYLFSLKNEQEINQTVMMPYSSKLKYFSHWFVQLWAESLGKKSSLKSAQVYEGLTPIASVGVTDQHSQMQLFMDGPRDKCIFFLDIQKFNQTKSLQNHYDPTILKQISPFNLNDIIRAELQGTMKSMEKFNRPFIHIEIEQLNEYYLGQLIMFFESLTVLLGQFLDINPFDQPGVEEGKRITKEILQGQSPQISL